MRLGKSGLRTSWKKIVTSIKSREICSGVPRRGGTRRRRANKTNRKRKRYADTQELFKGCPKRLADLVRRNQLRGLLNDIPEVTPPATCGGD